MAADTLTTRATPNLPLNASWCHAAGQKAGFAVAATEGCQSPRGQQGAVCEPLRPVKGGAGNEHRRGAALARPAFYITKIG